MSMRELFMAGISANELHGEEGTKVTHRKTRKLLHGFYRLLKYGIVREFSTITLH